MIQISVGAAAILTSLFSAVLQILGHYLPMVGIQRLQPPAPYIRGVQTALIPASACTLAAEPEAAQPLGIAWLSFLVSRAAVGRCYAADTLRAGRRARQEAELLRSKLDGSAD